MTHSKGRTVPARGKGDLGNNEWEWFQHERGEKTGEFVRTTTQGKAFMGRNRHARRRAIMLKRRGMG